MVLPKRLSTMFREAISSCPQEDLDKLCIAENQIRDVIYRHGAMGEVASILIGFEMMDKQYGPTQIKSKYISDEVKNG